MDVIPPLEKPFEQPILPLNVNIYGSTLPAHVLVGTIQQNIEQLIRDIFALVPGTKTEQKTEDSATQTQEPEKPFVKNGGLIFSENLSHSGELNRVDLLTEGARNLIDQYGTGYHKPVNNLLQGFAETTLNRADLSLPSLRRDLTKIAGQCWTEIEQEDTKDAKPMESLTPSQRITTELGKDTLSWKEIYRKSFIDQVGVESMEEARAHFQDRIPPHGVGDTFTYKLEGTEELEVSYWQNLFNIHVLRNLDMLEFNFKNIYGPYNAKMRFVMGQYTNPRYVEFRSEKHLGLYKEQYGEHNKFTPRGTETIEAIIAIRKRLTNVAGLKPDDKETLRLLLSRMKTDSKKGQLIPCHCDP